MPFLNDSEREERKRQLRRNMRVNRELIEEEREAEEDLYADSEDVSDAGPDRYDGYGDEDGYDSGNGEAVDEEEVASVEKRIRGKKLDRRKKIVLIAACAAAVVVIVLLVLTFSGWRSVSKKWTVDMPGADLVAFEPLGTGVVRYSRDGAAFYDTRGENIWNQGFEMNAPLSGTASGRLALADNGGTSLYLFDVNGCTGHAETNYEIANVCIASNGYAAVVSEYEDAAYINYYAPDGTPVAIEVKTVLPGEGYPVDLALSDDGAILMVSYAYLEGGGLSNRVVFYNFSEEGETATQRIVGGFEQYEGSIAADVEMLEGNAAVAFAEDRVSFYSLTNRVSPQLVKEIEVEGQILSVACSGDRAAIVQSSEEEAGAYVVSIYSSSGSLVRQFTTTLPYNRVFFADGYLMLTNSETCEIYTPAGKLKYEGPLAGNISRVICADGYWYMAGGDSLYRFAFGVI
ncbi:MAG: hypothetical protein IJG61_04795 [Lachnospiraceae bacterium]|nr:hypothetical protein [Lachnospiraceae bacterium]